MGVYLSRLSGDFFQSEPQLPLHNDSKATITREPRCGNSLTAVSEQSTAPPKDTPQKKNTAGNKTTHPDLIAYMNGPETSALARATRKTEPAQMLVEKWKGQCDSSFVSDRLIYGRIASDPEIVQLYQKKLADFFDEVALNKDFKELIEKFPKDTDRTLTFGNSTISRFLDNEFDSQGEVIFASHKGDRGSSMSLAKTTDVANEKNQIVLGCSINFGGGTIWFGWGVEIARKSDFEKRETVN